MRSQSQRGTVPHRRNTLAYRVLLFDFVLVTTLITGLAVVMAAVERHILFEELTHQSRAFADFIARQSALAVLLETQNTLRDEGDKALAEPDFLYIAWIAADGRVIAMRSSSRWRGGLPARCPEKTVCIAADRTAYVEAAAPVIAESQPGLLDWSDGSSQQRRTVAVVRLGVSLQRFHRLVVAQVWSAVPLVLAVLLAGGLLRLAGLRRLGRPLNDLIQFTRRVAGGDLSARANIPALFEIAELAVAFNQMLAGLEASQRLREQMQAAEEANRLKTQFLANMSHELRTPLTGIIGMTQLALDTPLSVEQRDYLEAAWSSSNALLAQLNGILDLAKIEAGKMELHPTEFEPAEVIGQTIKSHAASAFEKSLRLTLHFEPDMPLKIRADRVRTCQIIGNLLSNAIKFTDSGRVVVRASIRKSPGGDAFLNVSVADTGPGVPPESRELIFSAFTQANGSNSRKHGGTGLGLAICSRLVDLMHGSIGIESTEGPGATFRFSVPVEIVEAAKAGPRPRVLIFSADGELSAAIAGVAAAAGLEPLACRPPAALREAGECSFALIDSGAAQEATSALALLGAVLSVTRIGWVIPRPQVNGPPSGFDVIPITEPVTPADVRKIYRESASVSDSIASLGGAVSGARVLVAEDSPVNQKLISTLLRKRGFNVTIAADGLKAVAAARSSPFDVILMDIQMPEMDGLEATRAIRAGEPPGGAHVPIVALTANAMGGDRELCLQSGMDDYLSKPVRAADLFSVIGKVLAEGAQTPMLP